MNIEVCSKCRQRIDDDKKLDENVWDCPVCGIEEYETEDVDIFSKKYELTEETLSYIGLAKILREECKRLYGEAPI